MDPKEKDELKGMLEDQAKEIKGTVDAVTQSQTKLDGIVGQLNTDIEKRGKELSEHKSRSNLSLRWKKSWTPWLRK